jgi:hypothetical protein
VEDCELLSDLAKPKALQLEAIGERILADAEDSTIRLVWVDEKRSDVAGGVVEGEVLAEEIDRITVEGVKVKEFVRVSDGKSSAILYDTSGLTVERCFLIASQLREHVESQEMIHRRRRNLCERLDPALSQFRRGPAGGKPLTRGIDHRRVDVDPIDDCP